MTTWIGTQLSLEKTINGLIELDYDAVAAYEVAIEHFKHQQYKEQMREFMRDHQRHIMDLKAAASHVCEHVASGPDLKQYLTMGKVQLAQLGGDRSILWAMLSNEEDTNSAYERAVQIPNLPGSLLALFERALSDERRHRAWMEQCLHPELHQHEYSEVAAAQTRAPLTSDKTAARL